MDPMNNPVPNPNLTAGGMNPGGDAGVGASMGAVNPGLTPDSQANPMAGNVVPDNSSFNIPGQDVGASSVPTGDAPNPVPPVPPVAPPPIPQSTGFNIPTQPIGGSMSAGQMFQPTGGVSTPMGALGAAPGDFASANSPLLSATDPITMPAPPKAPDPIEEELKAPFKAAGPVPGSIGSAVSMPGDPNQNPNVAFNDPATMAPNNSMMPKNGSFLSKLGLGGGKKMDKKTMIVLGVVLLLVVAGVVIVIVTAL